MKNILLAFIPTLILALSCKRDEINSDTQTEQTEQIETTVGEDKINISRSMENIVSCMSTMKDGDLMTAFVDFANISDGEALDEDFIEDLFENMEDAIDEIEIPDEVRFPFESFTGTWSYKISDHTWSHSDYPSSKIVVEFPSDKYQTSNNVTASLNDYKDKKYVIDMDGEGVWLPVSFELSLVKDGIQLAELDLNDLALEDLNDLIIPTNLDVSLFLNPFTFTFSGERTTSKVFNAETRFDDGSSCEYITNSKLVLAHDDYENLSDEDYSSLEGSFSHNEMKIEYFIGLGKIAELGNMNNELSDDDVNNNIDIKVLMSGQKVGDISIANDLENVIITYKNGESDDIEVYVDPFIEDLENLFNPVTGDFEEIW